MHLNLCKYELADNDIATMHEKLSVKLFCILSLMLVTGPSLAFQYRGDGEFIDQGFLSASDQYRLEFSLVNLCEAGSYSFSVGELPADALFLQLDYAYPKDITDEDAYLLVEAINSKVIIQLTLENTKEKTLIYKYEGRIYESGHDESGKYWRRGFPGFVSNGINGYGLKDNVIVFRVDDVAFHKGMFWQHHSVKNLNFSVITPFPSLTNCFARFVIRGGGWK